MAWESKNIRFFPYRLHIPGRSFQEDLIFQMLSFNQFLQLHNIGSVIVRAPEINFPLRKIFRQQGKGFNQQMLSLRSAGKTAYGSNHIFFFLFARMCLHSGFRNRIGNCRKMLIGKILFCLWDKRWKEDLNRGAPAKHLFLFFRRMHKNLIWIVMKHGNNRNRNLRMAQQQSPSRFSG